MFERTLPIGSVVLLKNASKRLKIIGYCKYKMGDEVTIYDQIERIYALGFQNEQRFLFEEKLRAAIHEVKPFEQQE